MSHDMSKHLPAKSLATKATRKKKSIKNTTVWEVVYDVLVNKHNVLKTTKMLSFNLVSIPDGQ